jgi:hypothetical protein
MELEQRVKTLEYEIKVLKSEIQRTLLDVQEQVLIHYYPNLRSEDRTAPKSAAPAAMPVLLEDDPRDPPLERRSAAPIVRQVSLDQVLTKQGGLPRDNGEISGMSQMLEWGLNSAATMGANRFKQLITVCETRGVLSPDLRDMFLRIALLNRRAAPETIGVPEMSEVVLQLDSILGRTPDIQEALELIEEAQLG